MKLKINFFKRDRLAKRIIMSIIGVLVSGFSVGLFKRSVFGVDPFTILVCGCDAVIPIPYGTVYVILNVLLLIVSLIFDRSKIGFATFVNLFLLGYVVDFSEKLMMNLFPQVTLAGRIAFLLVGIVILCFASAFYFTADMGVSTYDAVALILSQRHQKIHFRLWRIMTDLFCVIAGCGLFLLGNKMKGMEGKELIASVTSIAGVGSVVTAFFMGPLISFFRTHISEPFLYGKNKAGENKSGESADPSETDTQISTDETK